MNKDKVNLFLATNGKHFPQGSLITIKESLESIPDEKAFLVHSAEFKDPTSALIISILGGYLGLDRFYIGDIGLGVCKLLTCGGCGIWYLIDLFLISKTTREKNYDNFMATMI